jgi:hypothetical protein
MAGFQPRTSMGKDKYDNNITEKRKVVTETHRQHYFGTP